MSEKIKVSVIIPVYNVEKYLHECLDSVVNQTLKEIEIICVDDGSTDGSLSILQEYADNDSQVIVIKNKENSGLSITRNNGLDIAKGEYVYFLDSDDKIELDSLEVLFNKAKSDNLDILYFDGIAFFENIDLLKGAEWELEEFSSKAYFNGVYNGHEMFSQLINTNSYKAYAGTQMLRRKFLLDNNLYFKPKILFEDNIFTFKTILTAKRVGHIKKECYLRRVRGGSITRDNTQSASFKAFYGTFSTLIEMIFFVEKLDCTRNTAKSIQHEMRRIQNLTLIFYNKMSKKERRNMINLTPIERTFFVVIVDPKDYWWRQTQAQKQYNNKLNGQLRWAREEILNQKNIVIKLKSDLKLAQKELKSIKKSPSYEIGKIITYIPRKFSNFISCIKNNGIIYTIKKIFGKV